MHSQSKNRLFMFIAFLIDTAVAFAGFLASRFITGALLHNIEIGQIIFFLIYGFLILFFYMLDLYDLSKLSIENVCISIVLSVLASNVCTYIVNHFIVGETCTAVFWIIITAVEILLLGLWRVYASIMSRKIIGKKKLLVIESSDVTSRLARKLKYSMTYIYDTWYCIIDESRQNEVDFLLNTMLKEYDCIFISDNLSKELSNKIFHKAILLSKGICKLASFSNVAIRTGRISQFSDTPIIMEETIGLSRLQHIVKRVFDIIFSVIGLIVSSPILAILYVAIKLDSPGPAIYVQERYTIHKRRFNVYKFRTMKVDAEKYGAQFSEKNDPRITRVGRVIRALRLDELPQLYNILVGDMSVVGPRPERPVFADEFCEKVQDYEMRYFAYAGLTGYAQIYGKYNTRASDKALMDMIYITKYSFWLDIKLILLTIKTMFIRSSTDGVEEDLEQLLNSAEKEEARKNSSLVSKEGEVCAYKFVDTNSRI